MGYYESYHALVNFVILLSFTLSKHYPRLIANSAPPAVHHRSPPRTSSRQISRARILQLSINIFPARSPRNYRPYDFNVKFIDVTDSCFTFLSHLSCYLNGLPQAYPRFASTTLALPASRTVHQFPEAAAAPRRRRVVCGSLKAARPRHRGGGA